MDFVPRTVMIGGKVCIYFTVLTGHIIHTIHSFFLLFVHFFIIFLFCCYSVFPYTSKTKVDLIGQSAAIIKSSHQCIIFIICFFPVKQAAPGYYMAKLIIKLFNCIARGLHLLLFTVVTSNTEAE